MAAVAGATMGMPAMGMPTMGRSAMGVPPLTMTAVGMSAGGMPAVRVPAIAVNHARSPVFRQSAAPKSTPEGRGNARAEDAERPGAHPSGEAYPFLAVATAGTPVVRPALPCGSLQKQQQTPPMKTALDKAEITPPAPPVCCHCGHPILPGRPHWAGDPQNRPWHYDCAETMRLTRPLAAARPAPARMAADGGGDVRPAARWAGRPIRSGDIPRRCG